MSLFTIHYERGRSFLYLIYFVKFRLRNQQNRLFGLLAFTQHGSLMFSVIGCTELTLYLEFFGEFVQNVFLTILEK